MAESGQINGCQCFKPLNFGVACHTAIVMETVAIWSKSMTELNMTRTTPNPVILETSLHVEGRHVKARPESRDPLHRHHWDSCLLLWKLEPNSLPPWLMHLLYGHFSSLSPSITDGGGSCQNKLGQASQTGNTNCLDVFACLLAPLQVTHFSFYSCRIFPLGTQGLWVWKLCQGHQPSP